jgi:hypothetical protein
MAMPAWRIATRRALASWPDRTSDSAITQSASVPRRSSSVPKATTRPGRIPGTAPTASSTSSGNTLFPATMIRSFVRPTT